MQKAINHTMSFFVDGERPKQGLDEVDKLLIRKRELLRKCHHELVALKALPALLDEFGDACLVDARIDQPDR